MSKNYVRHWLDAAEKHGIIEHYELQSNMPGLRWSIHGSPGLHRSYSTREAEAFVEGIRTATYQEGKREIISR